MSGIAGIYYLDGRPVDEQVLKAMTDIVRHRGPDGIGQWVQGPVGLGHLQLCTTPESLRERQPLVSADGNYAITCDGRVDNREELIRDLRQVAPVTNDSTDVELILQAYIAWGPQCVKRIVGDFAFALWDSKRQQLFCARDPLGMRLFHYYFDGQRFLFGTEIKQIFSHPDVPRKLNEVMAGLLLARCEGDGEMSYYRDIRRLPGGYYVQVSPEGLVKQSYWDPDPGSRIVLDRDEEYEEEFLRLFQEAVRCRLRSAGAVGVKLSGGLDSSAVTSVAEQLRQRSNGQYPVLRAFSYTFRDRPGMDESGYVRALVQQYGTPVCWIFGDEIKQGSSFAPISRRYDEPFPVQHESLHRTTLQQVTESGVRVLLTGEGGDEWLTTGGMYLHLCDWARGLRFRRLWSELAPLSPAHRHLVVRVLLRSLRPSWLNGGSNRLLDNYRLPRWVDGRFRRRVHLDDALNAARADRRRYRTLYLQRQYNMLQTRGNSMGIMAGEQMAAEYAIEFRHPFHDIRLVDFLTRVPPEQKWHHGHTKYLLRRTVQGILPEAIRTRRGKTSFAPLFDASVQAQDGDYYRMLVEESRLAEVGIVDAAKLRRAFARYQQGDVSQRPDFFVFFPLEEWVRRTFPAVAP